MAPLMTLQWLYIGLFIFVNVWTVSIHDGEDMVPDWAQVCVARPNWLAHTASASL
jgi:hypothetical protein